MMKFALSIIMSVLSAVTFLPVTAAAQIQPLSDTGVSEQPFHRTRAQKGVKVSTDVFKERRPDGSDLHSFPSGHTAVSFATAAYLQRRYGWVYGGPAYALACYVGWGRCYSKKHYWYDVLAGAAIGAGSAYIFTRPFAKKHNLQISPVSDGTNIGVYASFEF